MSAPAIRDALFGADGASYDARASMCARELSSANRSPLGVGARVAGEWALAVASYAGASLASSSSTKAPPLRALGSDGATASDVVRDDRVWRALGRCGEVFGAGWGTSSAALGHALKALDARARATTTNSDDEDDVLARAFVAIDGALGWKFHASCEVCVDIAHAALERGLCATAAAACAGAAKATAAQPNKPAPVGVSFEFIWRVCAMWAACEGHGDRRALREACEGVMRGFILHPMYARAIPSVLTDSAPGRRGTAKKARTASGEGEGGEHGEGEGGGDVAVGAARGVPDFIRETMRRVARAAEDADDVALSVAPWLVRATYEAETKENKSDARDIFVGVFTPISHAFLSPMTTKKNKSKRRCATDAGDDALTRALTSLLTIAMDFKMYSSLDETVLEQALRDFVSRMASTAESQDANVRSRGWSSVVSALSALDFRLVEPHATTMLTLLLMRSQDTYDECVDVMRSMTNAFAETREMPDFIQAIGDALMSTRARSENRAHPALASQVVLNALGAAAETVPIGQTPELLEVCRKVFTATYDDASCEGVLDATANVLQCVIGGCPDVPGEPLLPAVRDCLEGFTNDIVTRIAKFATMDAMRVGACLRVYTSIAALLQGLSEVADETASAPYFRSSDAVELRDVVARLIRDKSSSLPEDAGAEAAAVGSAIQRIRLLSRLRCPREEITPDVAAKAGKEIKALQSACFRLVPDTSASTSYDAPDTASQAWSVLASSYEYWFEHIPEPRLMDYFRCLIETDTDETSTTAADEELFGQYISSFKTWSRTIASVLVRASTELVTSLSQRRGTKATALCDVLEDVITDCASGQSASASIDALNRFWMAASRLPIHEYVKQSAGTEGDDETRAAMKRLRRGISAAERLNDRGVMHMNTSEFSIAQKVSDALTFTAAALGEPEAIDLCIRVRKVGMFMCSHDESAADISCQVCVQEHYHEATLLFANELQGRDAPRLLGATTDEFHAALCGSAAIAKPNAHAKAYALVERLAREHLAPADKTVTNTAVNATPGCVFAALLTEAAFAATTCAHRPPEREQFGWVEGNPNLPAEPELTDAQGEIIARCWEGLNGLNAALEDALKCARESPTSDSTMSMEYVEVVGACVSAVGYGLAVSATSLECGEKYHRTYDPAVIQLAMAVSVNALLPKTSASDASKSTRGWAEVSSLACVKVVNFLGAACEALKATGPTLTPEAHASLVAVTMSTYTQCTRVATLESNIALACPDEELTYGLSLTLGELIHGAGKRPLNAMYAACIDAFKAIDAASRRAHVSSSTVNDTHRLDITLSAPLWCALTLVKSFNVGKAARASAQENAERLMDACTGVMHAAVTVKHANAVVCNILEIATEVARLGVRCEVSTRCVSRMCQLASAAHGADAVADDDEAQVLIFSQACELMGALLKARKEHLKRAVSSVTVVCSDLLNTLRRAKAAGASDDVMSKCASKLSFVYEAAESSGLDRYCTHLLADVITAITGGGVGTHAEKALKPGIFALLDSCSDRELQQLHAALGSGAGGARRVVFSALREDHKLTHKFDGKI